MGLAVEAPKRQDRRALWNDSKELRESVRADLEEWGDAQRGGFPDLGYPHEQPFVVTPSKMPPTYDADKVQAITDTITLWNLSQRQIRDIDRRAEVLRLLLVLKLHFISDAPADAKSKRMKVSKRTFWRLVDEATCRFWILHY